MKKWRYLCAMCLVVVLAGILILSHDAMAQTPQKGLTLDSIVKGAQKEGTVAWTSNLEEDEVVELNKAFQKEYPFIKKVEYVRTRSAEDIERTLSEMQAGMFNHDVMYSETELISRFEQLGLVIDPFDWRGVFGINPKMILPKGFGIMIGSNPAGIAYNKDKVAKAHVPKKWLDACDPYFKGKVAVDIRPIHMISLMAVYPQEWVLDYAKKLLANKPVWIRGQTAANTLLAAGEVLMTAPASHGSWYRARADVMKRTKDWPVEFVIPEGPVGCEAGLQLLPMKKANNPNAALLLTGWLASKGVVHLDTGRESAFHPGTKLGMKLDKLGRKVEVQSWELQANAGEMTKKILEIWGFPKASK